MKIVRAGALPVGGESGLLDVAARATAGAWHRAERGEVRAEDIWDRFVDRVLSFVDVDVAMSKPPKLTIKCRGARNAIGARVRRDDATVAICVHEAPSNSHVSSSGSPVLMLVPPASMQMPRMLSYSRCAPLRGDGLDETMQ